MTTTLANPSSRTVHLPTQEAAPVAPRKAGRGLVLTDLKAGETGRVVRLSLDDSGCRKRLAELGLVEGMKVTVASTGETMMLVIGGCRLGIGAGCAAGIHVVRA